jgi:hypothetical protein
VIRFEEPHRILAEDGANAALLEAKQQGKLKYIGFTGHKDPLIHLGTAVVITGIDSMEILDQAFKAAETFHPMSDVEVKRILSKARGAALRSEFEPRITGPSTDRAIPSTRSSRPYFVLSAR